MIKFKVEDEVEVKEKHYSYGVGEVFKIKEICVSAGVEYVRRNNQSDWIESYKVKLKNMSLKESFQLAFKAEPERSFRKAGITNGDDYLTDEGTSVFLSWLLKKHGDEFKKDVVDPILKEKEENK